MPNLSASHSVAGRVCWHDLWAVQRSDSAGACGQMPLYRSRRPKLFWAPALTTKQHARRRVWPTALVVLTLGMVPFLFYTDISGVVEDSETLLIGLKALSYFAMAWHVSRLSALALDQATAWRRP